MPQIPLSRKRNGLSITPAHTRMAVLAIHKLRNGEHLNLKSLTKNHFGQYLSLIEEMFDTLRTWRNGGESDATLPETMRDYWDMIRQEPRWLALAAAVDAVDIEDAARPVDTAETPAAETPTIRGKKLKDLMRQMFPVPRAIVAQVILEGTTLLAGPPKIGKSRLVLDIAMAVAAGSKALGSLPVEPGPVLYVSLEDHERRLQRRARGMLTEGNREQDAPEHFEYETAWPRLDDGGLVALEAWIVAHPGAKLIVIDTLQRIRPKPKPGQGVYAADYEALQGLTDLVHRHEGLAIVVVHHTNKKKEVDDYMDLISGSTGLPGSADGFMVMQRKRGQEDAVLNVVHRDLDEDQEHALHSDALTGGWTFMGPASQQPNSPEQRAIMEVLAEAVEPMTPKGIAEVISKKADAVRFLLWKMEKVGLVERASTGKYVLPTDIANTTNTTNTTNAPEATRPRRALVALVPTANGTNAHKPLILHGLEANVSGVSGVSGVAQCEVCGQQDWAEMNGHPVCMTCLRREV